ncbi:MAG: tetratricopeptide repeat protein [Candidatus Hodarchaeota archaeon]
MKDPKRILAEVKSLKEAYRYDRAEHKLREALDLNLDNEIKRQSLLLGLELALCQGTEIDANLLIELQDLLISDMSAEARAETLHVMSRVARRQGQYQKAADLGQEALNLSQSASNPKATVSVLNTLAQVYGQQGRWNELMTATTEALQLARECGDSQGYAEALMSFALFERLQGRQDLARDYYESAGQFLEATGDNRNLALVLSNLADLEVTQGNLTLGLRLFQQALFQWKAVGQQGKVALMLTQLGRVSVLKGSLQDAEAYLRAAIDVASPDQSNHPLTHSYALCKKADFERTRGQLDKALTLARQAITRLEEAQITGVDLGYAWGIFTSILLEMKEIAQAEEALATGEFICSSLAFQEGIVNNILLRGILELEKGNLGLAQEFLERASNEAENSKFFETQIQAELALADLYLRKLKISYNKSWQDSATNCLLRATDLAEKSALEPWKLEAQLLRAVIDSINLRFEKAVESCQDVESTARSLKLHLIEERARRIRLPIKSRMRALGIPTAPDEEVMEYIIKAQEYIAEAQTAFRRT